MTATATLQAGNAVATLAPTAAPDAISTLWRLHGTALTRFALRLTLGDLQRAEDIVQETLLRAWRHPEVVDGREHKVLPWLVTVARHVAIDMWRARSRGPEMVGDEQADSPDVTDHIERAVTALDMRAALAQLSPEHRQVVGELYFHDRSVAQTAQKLGVPAGTVKSRAYYALRHLKQVLEPESQASGTTTAPALRVA